MTEICIIHRQIFGHDGTDLQFPCSETFVEVPRFKEPEWAFRERMIAKMQELNQKAEAFAARPYTRPDNWDLRFYVVRYLPTTLYEEPVK